MIIDSKLPKYLPRINQIAHVHTFSKIHLLTESFLLDKEGDLSMYYAPHNEYIETCARVVFVGITPGFQQMRKAIQSVARNLQHYTIEQLIYDAKVEASLAGPMRTNLIEMLDACGLAQQLQIKTSANLFTTNRSMLHTTSMIKYPVFYKGKNYTGYQPKVEQSTMLKRYVYDAFPREIQALTNPCLMIPLGKAVHQLIDDLKDIIPSQHTIIDGFPHPSGANGHRMKQFIENKKQITASIKKWSLKYN